MTEHRRGDDDSHIMIRLARCNNLAGNARSHAAENQPVAPRWSSASWKGGVTGFTGTFQISWAYSRMVRSEENQAMRATLRMEARVQAGATCQRASTLRCAS